MRSKTAHPDKKKIKNHCPKSNFPEERTEKLVCCAWALDQTGFGRGGERVY